MTDYFGLESHIAPLESSLASAIDPHRVETLATLAWYLRQRDGQRALALADEATIALIADHALDERSRMLVQGRIALARAEVLRLRMELEPAEELVKQARTTFDACGDQIGVGDTYLIEQGVAVNASDYDRRIACNEKAAEIYQAAGDELRWRIASAYRALSCNSYVKDHMDWDLAFSAAARLRHPGLNASLAMARSWHCFLHGDLAEGTRLMIRHQNDAVASGQLRTAIFMLLNVGDNYSALSDYAEAVEWLDKGLQMARRAGWTKDIGQALAQLGEALHRLGRLDAARAMFDEGLALYENDQASIGFIMLKGNLADLLMTQGAHAEALQIYRRMEELGRLLNFGNHVEDALRGQACALLKLDRAGDALKAVEESLELSRQREAVKPQVESLRVLAEVARAGRLPAPEGSLSRSGAVHYLEQALETAKSMEAYAVPSELHSELSRDYEEVGELRRALLSERAAAAAREASHSRRAADMATALQIRYETDRAKAQAEIERLRAENLEAANRQLAIEAERLQRATYEDALTGLYNRRRLDKALAMAGDERRPRQGYCVVLLDIDHFKRVNDTFSHLVGDEVLRRLGRILHERSRHSDLPARYGGEEFALVLYDIGRDRAHMICDRLREAVQRYAWSEIHPQLAVTVSIGIAGSDEAENATELLAIADKRLYAAKSAGRNMVMSGTAGLSTSPAPL